MSTIISSRCSSQITQHDLDTTETIHGLIQFPNEEFIDMAFEVAKNDLGGRQSSAMLHFMLSDIAAAYLKLETLEGCRKAYAVAQYKEAKGDVGTLLDSIIEKCIQLQTRETIILAEEIYQYHPQSLRYSTHKNDFNGVKAKIESSSGKIIIQKRPKERLPINFNEIVQPSASAPKQEIPEIAINSIKPTEAPLNKEDEVEKAIFDALKSGDLDELRTLLTSLGASVKEKALASVMKFKSDWASGQEEMTPLQYACFLGKTDAVKLLIEQGALVNDFRNTSDSTQRGALHFALDEGHSAAALVLLEHGAVDEVASCTYFHGSRKYQLPEEYGGSWTCLSALHIAIIQKMPEIVEKLLELKVSNLKEKASGSTTCLELAYRGKDLEMDKLLRKYGATFH